MTSTTASPAAPAGWTEEQTQIARQRPRALAAALAVTCSDLPGFDNADRAHMRRVALALLHGNNDEALALALRAVQDRASCGAKRARPEAVILEAVLWLLVHHPQSAPASATEG